MLMKSPLRAVAIAVINILLPIENSVELRTINAPGDEITETGILIGTPVRIGEMLRNVTYVDSYSNN
jgi:hypothetical protein